MENTRKKLSQLVFRNLFIIVQVVVSCNCSYGSDKISELFYSIDTCSSATQRIDLRNNLAYRYLRYKPDSGIYYAQVALTESAEIKYEIGVAISTKWQGYYYYLKGDFDSSYFYYDRAEEILIRNNDFSKLAGVIKLRASGKFRQGKAKEAIELLKSALKYSEQGNNKKELAGIWNNLGVMYAEIFNVRASLEAYKKALKFKEELGDVQSTSSTLLNIGTCYYNLKEYDLALSNYHRALKIKVQFQDKKGESIAVSNIGLFHLDAQSLDSALIYYQRSLHLNKTLGYECEIIYPIQGLAEIYTNIGRFDSAYYYGARALEISKKCEDLRGEAVTLLLTGDLKIKVQDLKGAEIDLLQSYQISMDIGELKNAMQAAELLYGMFKKQNRDKKTIFYLERFKILSDSIFNESNSQEIARLDANYGFIQEKKQLIVEQEKEELILQNELKRQKIIQYAALSGGLLFLLLFVSFYISNRRKKRDNEVIRNQNQQLERLSEYKEGLTHMIAHDMKNSLNTILGFSSSEPFDQRMKSINHSGQVLLNLVTNMLDVQRFEEAEVHLDLKMCNLNDLVEQSRLQVELLLKMKNLHLEESTIHSNLINVDSDLMIRVLVNLLNNAIKYSKPGGLIKIKSQVIVQEESQFAQFIVEDEGEGISESQLPFIFDKFWKDSSNAYGPVISSGLGLTFCKLAVEAHRGYINVTSERGKGSIFSVYIPMDSKEIVSLSKNRSSDNEEEYTLILDAEKEQLKKLSLELQEYEVFQVGEISVLLDKYGKEHIQSEWKKKLEIAINNGDENAYNELLNLLK